MNIINSSWMRWLPGFGPRAARAKCHRSPTQWLPKPATSQLPEKRRSLRELWSASQEGTGMCWRTATGEGLEQLVVAKRFDVAWAPGGGGAVDRVDLVDIVDRMDERLRLDRG